MTPGTITEVSRMAIELTTNRETTKDVRVTGLESTQAAVPEFFSATRTRCMMIITPKATNIPPKMPYIKMGSGISPPSWAILVDANIGIKIIKLMIENHIARCFHHLEDLNQAEYSPCNKLPKPRFQPFSLTS